MHLIRLRVDNARVFQRDFNVTVGQAACWMVSTYSKHFDCVLRLVNLVDCYVWIRRKVRYAPDQSLKVVVQIRDMCKASIILQ